MQKLPMGKVSGFLHIGAHEAEELEGYLLSGVRRVAWIEANPETIPLLEAKLAGLGQMRLGHFAAGSENGLMTLNVASNGQSSSLLQFGTHQLEHPQVVFTRHVEVRVRKVDDWIDELGLDRSHYKFINLDIQGYELRALQGAVRQLPYVDFVYTEINDKEVYAGCPLIGDIDEFLAKFGFRRIAPAMTQHGWGDAFYFKASP